MTLTIYADSNIYRYLARGELEITTIGSVRFAYSSVHFDEMIRSQNSEALDGMRLINAVPMVSNEDKSHGIDSLGVCFEYEDPHKKFEKYRVETIGVNHDMEMALYDFLVRLMGAENFEELQKIPDMIVEVARELSECVDSNEVISRAAEEADKFRNHLHNDLIHAFPIGETRKAFGFPKGANSKCVGVENPIDVIWEHMRGRCRGVSKDQFFGFEVVPGVRDEISHTGSIAACHMILNMVGFSPDKGLSKKEKIRNIVSDGQHLGLASMCDYFLTADERFFNKAEAIFKYRKANTRSIYLPYFASGMSFVMAEPGSIRKFKNEKT